MFHVWVVTAIQTMILHDLFMRFCFVSLNYMNNISYREQSLPRMLDCFTGYFTRFCVKHFPTGSVLPILLKYKEESVTTIFYVYAFFCSCMEKLVVKETREGKWRRISCLTIHIGLQSPRTLIISVKTRWGRALNCQELSIQIQYHDLQCN